MSLETQITDDMLAAMKAGDKAAVGTLRMAIAAIKNEKVAGDVARELTDDDVAKVLRSEVNKRKDAAQAYTDAARPELAEKELAEADILGRYLPEPLSESEVDQIVADALAQAEQEAGEKPGMRQMGQIMKAVNVVVAGRADGKLIAGKVKAALA